MDNDPYLDRLVETFSKREEEEEETEEMAFSGCFIPSDSPLVAPKTSAPLEDKLDFIVARAIYFNPRLSLCDYGGDKMLFTGEELLETSVLSKNPIAKLSHMSLSTDMARLSLMRLLTTLPRASSSLIEISPTLVWDKDKGELKEIKKTKRRKLRRRKK